MSRKNQMDRPTRNIISPGLVERPKGLLPQLGDTVCCRVKLLIGPGATILESRTKGGG